KKCPACFKRYISSTGEFFYHLKFWHHSVHQPRCGVCLKHCRSFESVREHLHVTVPDGLSRPFKEKCSEIFAKQGCTLCLKVFEDATALAEHIKMCRLSPPPPFEPDILFPEVNASPARGLNTSGTRMKAMALDCEMVGGGDDGSLDLCATVCLVDQDEKVILFTLVQPQQTVTDYREAVTGLTEEDLKQGMRLEDVRDRVLEILRGDGGHLLIGHDLIHDMRCLQLQYPRALWRDTAKYEPLMKTNLVSHSLKYLTRSYLGYEIQCGKHNPYEDCVSVMRLYKKIRDQGLNSCTQNDKMKKQQELQNVYSNSTSAYVCWCHDN
ncbi:unnamed protein product, partial [Thlaspi arvense]